MTDKSEQQHLNIYEDNVSDINTVNLSSKGLQIVPDISNKLLSVIYLQNNKIFSIPDSFFPSLPNLKWLDLRDNNLSNIPKTIKNHLSLAHFLLQNNKIIHLPNELGTLPNLKVLQLGGNPIIYPKLDIIKEGTGKVLSFLQENYLNEISESPSHLSDTNFDNSDNFFNHKARSYNSVLDELKPKLRHTLSVQFSEKDNDEPELVYYTQNRGKCPKLPKSRSQTLLHFQSSKYLKPLRACNKFAQDEKIKDSFLKEMKLKKKKEFITTRDKILQGRRNCEQLKIWRKNYGSQLSSLSKCDSKLVAMDFPYDTNPECMTILTRKDIEKDLPDKLKKRLIRKPKPSIPRKSNEDVHLAMKIKELFENLEAMDINREAMTPRTEQRALLGEINRITEIKQKLKELSATNLICGPNN